YPPDELIASADLAESDSPRFQIAAAEFPRNEPVDLALRYAMVPTGCFGRVDLAAINPLLQRGIADPQNSCCFARGQQGSAVHGNLPRRFVNRLNRHSNTIRFEFKNSVKTVSPGISGLDN